MSDVIHSRHCLHFRRAYRWLLLSANGSVLEHMGSSYLVQMGPSQSIQVYLTQCTWVRLRIYGSVLKCIGGAYLSYGQLLLSANGSLLEHIGVPYLVHMGPSQNIRIGLKMYRRRLFIIWVALTQCKWVALRAYRCTLLSAYGSVLEHMGSSYLVHMGPSMGLRSLRA